MRTLALFGALALVALAAPAHGPERPPVDNRSLELVRRDCSTRLGRHELTLFANGTIRLREWRDAERTMALAELGREEIEAYRRRFAEIDLRETPERPPRGVSGEWVERCDLVLAGELELRLRSDDPRLRRFHFGAFDTFDLAFASLLRIVDELEERAVASARVGELPADYRPRVGDRLLRADRVEFEVVGFTVIGDGVELRGTLAPLTLYVPRADLPIHFIEVVRRGP
jgi:hypothetical protein